MNRKRRIREKHIAQVSVSTEMAIEGEPMIYSVKFKVGERQTSLAQLRNMKWKSILKCCFRSYMKKNQKVVLLIRFYVTPPAHISLEPETLRKEKLPATESHEICEYLLSFLELLNHVLVNCYRQFVKIDAEKYYSDNPRTVFKFMKWEHYDAHKNHDPLYTKTKRVSANREEKRLQSKPEGYVVGERVCKERARAPAAISPADTNGAPTSCPTL